MIFCMLGYLAAFQCCRSGRHRVALAFILFTGLILRIYVATDFFLHPWDERYHALVAKNFLKHLWVPTLYDRPPLPFDPSNFTIIHIWLAKPPIPLWAMAGSIAVFGVDNELLLRILAILFSTASIGLTYFIARQLFDRKIALLAAFLHSIHGLLIELTAGRVSSDVVDTVFVFFVELAIFFAIFAVKKPRSYGWLIACGLATGLAFLCKWHPAFIVWLIWFSYATYSRKYSLQRLATHGGLLVVSTAVVLLPWCTYLFFSYPTETKILIDGLWAPVNTVVQGHTGSVWYYLNDAHRIW